MVTPFLTLQQLSLLFSKPSSVLMQDTQAPLSTAEKLLLSEEEEQAQAMALLAREPLQRFKEVA